MKDWKEYGKEIFKLIGLAAAFIMAIFVIPILFMWGWNKGLPIIVEMIDPSRRSIREINIIESLAIVLFLGICGTLVFGKVNNNNSNN